MSGAMLVDEMAILDRLVALLKLHHRRVPLTMVGQEIFRLQNPRNHLFEPMLRHLIKNDPRFEISPDGSVELLPDHREQTRLPDCEFVVIDIETTGINRRWDRITEVAAFKVHLVDERGINPANPTVEDEYSVLVNPQRLIPDWITRFTGITNQMVADSPCFGLVAGRLIEFIDNAVIVAHNARFDVDFLNSEIHRVVDKRLSNLRLCTLELSRRLFPELPNHKLHTVAHHLGVSIEGRHRARGDALATAQILIRMFRYLQDEGVMTLVDVKEFCRGRKNHRKHRQTRRYRAKRK